MHNDYFGEGGETGERVSHRALDVAAWEGAGAEVRRQTAVSNEEGMSREWPRQQGSAAPSVTVSKKASAIKS